MLVVIMAGEKIGYKGWWIYYTAPFVGAGVAALICKYLFGVLGDGDGVLGDSEPVVEVKDPEETLEHED